MEITLKGTIQKLLLAYLLVFSGLGFAHTPPAELSAAPTATAVSSALAACFSAVSGNPISATVSGNNTAAGYVTVFALTNEAGSILSINSTGTFVAPATAGNYKIYAVNYNSAAAPQPTLAAGTNITAIGGSCTAVSAPKCFDVVNAPACTNAFTGAAISATVSGNNTAAGYTTIFALTNASGSIISTNGTGSFTAPASAGTYYIYAVNYNTQTPPQPVFTSGTNITAIGGGCVDVSAPKCFNITNCPAPTVTVNGSPSASICKGSSVTLAASNCSGTVTWSTGATGTTLAVAPATTTTYTATCTVSGCTSVASAGLTVTVTDCRSIYALNDNNVTLVNTPIAGNVVTNDIIYTGTLPFVVTTVPISAPANGQVVLNSNGSYTYSPNTGYTGTDTFRYRVCDSSVPSVCDTATVFIKIYAAPSTTVNNPPIAQADVAVTTVNTPVSSGVLANDRDPDATQTLTTVLLLQPTNGRLTFFNNGIYTYTPNTGFVGEDTFRYRVCDSGTPQLCDETTVQITVQPAPPTGTNVPPVAADDYAITKSGVPVTATLSGNDYDPEGTSLTYTATPVTAPAHGTVTIQPNGSYTYTPATGYVGTDAFVYRVCDNGSPRQCTNATAYITIIGGKVFLAAKAYLQGALFGVTLPDVLMRDDLRAKGLIPLSSPYPAIGLNPLTPVGNTTSNALATTGANAIVDWVFVELRSATSVTTVVDSRPALIQRDGDIVDVDGVSNVSFTNSQAGSYYVVIRHRNHLGIMSKGPVALGELVNVVDFRLASTPVYSLSTNIIDQPTVAVQQGVAMWAGNVLFDNKIIYQGTGNDVNPIYQTIVNSTANVLNSPFFKARVYSDADVNLNGEVIFQGTGNDVEYIYLNVTKNHPGNALKQNFFVIKEQLPN